MKRILFFMLLAATMTAAAQNNNRPGWTVQIPKAGNSTYMYVVERATGTTYQEATNNAILKVLRTTMMRIGSVVSWDEVNSAILKGTDWGTVTMQYNIPINKVCEYAQKAENGGYIVWILCQVAKSGNIPPDFEEFTSCNDIKTYNNGTAALKSALLPGLGQISKRHYVSGIATMTGEAVLVLGTLMTYTNAKSYLSDISEKTNPNDYIQCIQSYDETRTACIVFASAATTLYVYNIIRAATMTPKYKKDIIAVVPYMMPLDHTLAAGVGLTFNF